MADIMQAGNANQDISMNISLSGSNIYQVGNQVTEYAIRSSANGSVGINVYNESNVVDKALAGGVKSLLGQQYKDIFKSTFNKKIKSSQEQHEIFSTALAQSIPINTSFSQSQLSYDLQLVAQTIASRNFLGVKRQTFFINVGGWDHHDEVLNNQVAMLAVVSKALSEFQSAMEELGLSDHVTTFSISDFGRTLTSNGNGTDHAWGGNVMAMGGSVKGGRLYGEYPSLAIGGKDDVGGAIVLPKISTDEYFAELCQWYGVPTSDLPYVLPNIGNFYNINGAAPPIGFMSL